MPSVELGCFEDVGRAPPELRQLLCMFDSSLHRVCFCLSAIVSFHSFRDSHCLASCMDDVWWRDFRSWKMTVISPGLMPVPIRLGHAPVIKSFRSTKILLIGRWRWGGYPVRFWLQRSKRLGLMTLRSLSYDTQLYLEYPETMDIPYSITSKPV